MTRTTFQNQKPDGSPRVMLGLWRPFTVDILLEYPYDEDPTLERARSIHSNPIAEGWYDKPIYAVDEDEDFHETHCLVLGTKHCPAVEPWRYGEQTELVRARHADCPSEASVWIEVGIEPEA